MGLVKQLYNKISYKLNELTYDENAEEYAQRQEQETLENQKKAQLLKEEELKQKKESKTKELEEKSRVLQEATQKKNEERAVSRESFSFTRMIGNAFGTTLSVILFFLLFAGGIFGASLATNLNLYRSLPYRILYMIYGFIFFPIVILYVFVYRWFWKEKRPRFYALMPLIPYHLNHPWAAQFFSWASYRPDDQIASLREWESEQA